VVTQDVTPASKHDLLHLALRFEDSPAQCL
jgi:hypothetical protein